MQKKIYRLLPYILALFVVIISITMSSHANATVANDSESYYEVYNSDYEKILSIIMKNGEITIVAKSHAATSSIRWRTMGLTITRKKINSSVSVKGHTGPGPVSDAYGNGYAVLMFANAVSKVDSKAGNVVTTTITFSAEQVEAALKEDFDDITKDTTIYLHGIFETYDYNASSGTSTVRKSNLKNWKDIMNAEWWGESTLGDFTKYFNMPIEFKPAPQPNTLYYYTTDGSKLGSKELDSVLPNNNVSWSNEPEQKTKGSKKYNLIGYYVTKKTDKSAKKTVERYIDDGYPLSQIKSGNVKVKLGGMNIFLIYKGEDNVSGTPTPTPKVTPIPEPTAIPVITPVPETISEPINMPEAEGSIRADIRGSERFIVTSGIPTTESLYTEVISDRYLMGYSLTKRVGIESYSVKVTKNYILTWEGKDANGVKEMSETVTVTKYVTIRRAYGYWEIDNFDCYKIDNARIDNYALPGGSTVMIPNTSAGYSVPSISINHSSSKDEHIIIPNEIKNGITLPAESIIGGTDKPSVRNEDFTVMAHNLIPELTIKNDYLSINGVTVISNVPALKEGPAVNRSYLSEVKSDGKQKCNNNVLYKPNQIIDAKKKNGTYNSTGIITYSRIAGVNSLYNNTIQANIMNLSSVVIHTPVLCNPIVEADNAKYVQLIKPTDATQLVLDPDHTLNDFKLTISNYGLHSNKQGYYTRDFSRSLRDPDNVSYLAEENGKLLNEVKFPFDIYLKTSEGDKYIKKNTWIVLGRSTGTFYLPMWTKEGIYTVECRSIAVNADMSMLDKITEDYVNSQLFNYVARNTFQLEVSGRIYGLSIYDITDYPMWEEVFRVKNSLDLKINNQAKYPDGTTKANYGKNYSYNYTVGTNDQYGKDTVRKSKFTFPLVNGDHPYYKNVGILKTGYVVRFKLNTVGTMYGNGCKIKIKPTFYFVDAEGKNRTKVDIYYEEEIDGKNRSLVKIGSNLDKLNTKIMEVGSRYTGIPETELKDTAALLKLKYSSLIYRRDNIFTFNQIDILSTFRTFVNKTYTNKIVNSSEYDKIKNAGFKEDDIMKQMQSWYACYYLPGIMHAVDPRDVPNGWTVYEYAEKKGITYKEDWWKKDGYIIVNFDIVTIDSEGNERLSYINANNYLNNGNCSMWTMEGAPLSKTDNKGVTFNFKAGDFIIYYVDQSVQNDYSVGGLY